MTLNKYQSLADTDIEGVLKKQSDFLRWWHGISLSTSVSLHLLYCFDNSQQKGQRLTLYFFICADEKKNLEFLRPLIHKSPLSDFYIFLECELPVIKFNAGATLYKKERIHNSFKKENEMFYFVPHWKVNESARLYDLFKMMETVGTSYGDNFCCAYRVDLYAQSLAEDTVSDFSPIIKKLQGDYDVNLSSRTSADKKDNYLYSIKREYEDWMMNVQTSPHFRMNVFAFADNILSSEMLLNSAASEAIDEGDFELLKSEEEYNILSKLKGTPKDYCRLGDDYKLKSWSTTYLLSEVEPFFRFPALFDGENIELPKETDPGYVSGENSIRIGVDTNGYVVNFPVEFLPKHAFFTGTPGAGKTNTMLIIANQLHDKGIPFLVMEPAKKEYRELLCKPQMHDVYLFSPHLRSYFPLRINPFDFPEGTSVHDHIEAILEALKGSFDFQGGVYKILSASIEKAYMKKGWEIDEVKNSDKKKKIPTFSEVYKIIEQELEENPEYSYEGDIKGNMKGWIQTRLGILMERSTGELFDTSVSTLSPEKWLTSSAIVELEALSKPAKNFFVLLMCTYIRETLKATPRSKEEKKKNPVRHVIFIEEAHNIIAPSSEQQSVETVDPKVSATIYIKDMLAEVRALGEAIVIADQLPTALTPEVTKNTGLKLIHRLIAQDDRSFIGSSVSATPLQLEQIANYSKGKALIYYEDVKKPFEVQVDYWEKPKIDFSFEIDSELYRYIHKSFCAASGVMSFLEDFEQKVLKPIYENKDLDKRFDQMKKARDKLESAAELFLYSVKEMHETDDTEMYFWVNNKFIKIVNVLDPELQKLTCELLQQ